MTNYIERIIDINTDEVIERDFTAAEIKVVEEAQAKAAIYNEEKAAERVLKSALLEKLGITEDEARLLLG